MKFSLLVREEPPVRMDKAGSGMFGAPRGSRTHNGVDYLARPNDGVCSTVNGTVTKLGFPYNGNIHYRYVEVTDGKGFRHRFFYVSPFVEVGEPIVTGQVIGEAQNVAANYPDSGMNNHIHYEIKTKAGKFVNPEGFNYT